MNTYQETAGKVARLAGEELIHRLTKNGGQKAIHEKDFGETVTNFDREINQFIIDELQDHFPDHDIVTEEAPPIEGSSSLHRWFIDPIDGTNNFIRNIPLYCVSIGYEQTSELTAGAIYDPVNRLLFHGSMQEGGFMEDVPLNVSATNELKDAMVASGYGYAEEHHKRHAPIWSELTLKAKATRNLGSGALMLAYVARGDIDAMVVTGNKAWDNAAGAVLVRAAGGRVTDYEGNDWRPGMETIIASNGKVHEELVELVRS